MEKTVKYIESNIQIEVLYSGALTIMGANGLAVIPKTAVSDLFILLDSPEVRQALGLAPVVVVPAPVIAPALPDVIQTEDDLELDWEDGTRVESADGLVHTRVNGEWKHDETLSPGGTDWCDCGWSFALPATVLK